jgi:hypothetical protein
VYIKSLIDPSVDYVPRLLPNLLECERDVTKGVVIETPGDEHYEARLVGENDDKIFMSSDPRRSRLEALEVLLDEMKMIADGRLGEEVVGTGNVEDLEFNDNGSYTRILINA